MENNMEVPQKTENRGTIRSSNPTPGHIVMQNYNSKRCMHCYVDTSTIHNSQDMETIYIDRWIDKEDGVYMQLNIEREVQMLATTLWINHTSVKKKTL